MRRCFDGQTVLVSGAAHGLGRALCERFGHAGARIGGLDREAEALRTTAAELADRGIVIATEVCDVRDPDAVVAAVTRLEQRLGPTAVVIHNAGITHRRLFDAGEVEAVRRVTEVNFLGAVHLAAAVHGQVVAQGGLFIAISSVAGFAPLVGRTGYAASKHALHGFFNTLRCELRGTDAGVLVVCPSFIATDLRRREPSTAAEDPWRTIGSEDAPAAVAERIFRAATRNRRQITTGRVGWLSSWLYRFAPRLRKRLPDGPEGHCASSSRYLTPGTSSVSLRIRKMLDL
jgi:NAD(P)-dependent dehydrogenase (short-subunit alcohol dehydrogenase family)